MSVDTNVSCVKSLSTKSGRIRFVDRGELGVLVVLLEVRRGHAAPENSRHQKARTP